MEVGDQFECSRRGKKWPRSPASLPHCDFGVPVPASQQRTGPSSVTSVTAASLRRPRSRDTRCRPTATNPTSVTAARPLSATRATSPATRLCIRVWPCPARPPPNPTSAAQGSWDQDGQRTVEKAEWGPGPRRAEAGSRPRPDPNVGLALSRLCLVTHSTPCIVCLFSEKLCPVSLPSLESEKLIPMLSPSVGFLHLSIYSDSGPGPLAHGIQLWLP